MVRYFTFPSPQKTFANLKVKFASEQMKYMGNLTSETEMLREFPHFPEYRQHLSVSVHSHTSVFQTPPAEGGRCLNVSLDEMFFRLRTSSCGRMWIGMKECLSLPGLEASLRLLVLLLESPLLLAVRSWPCNCNAYSYFVRLSAVLQILFFTWCHSLHKKKTLLIYKISRGMANKTRSLIVFPVIIYFSENFLHVTLLV